MNDQNIADLIQHLATARGWTETYASRMSAGSGDLLCRLRAGNSVTLRRANTIVQRISELWPEDLAWPDGIERPQPDKTPTRAA
jgi:hypothetical protein